MTKHEFEQLITSIREDRAPDQAEREATSRVYARMEEAALETGGACAGFRAQFAAYREGSLGEARRMLLEDHLHSCVACRLEYGGERKAEVPSLSARRPKFVRWGVPLALAATAAAVAIIVAPAVFDRAFSPSGERATIASVDGSLFRLTSHGEEAMKPGMTIGENEAIRTAKGAHAIVALRDGSRVELGERSEMSVSERWSGKTIHLARGAVLVEAAKQRRGRLEVSTPDCLVSVKGTIFSVARGLKGSRVSVVEGEVKVDQDQATRLLHKGDQTTTHPSMATTPVAQDVSWSENSAKYLALLGELSTIQKRIESIPGPGLRYTSKLTAILPENTAIFASIPNLGPTLAEANKIIEERVQQSSVLSQWWNGRESQQMRDVLDRVRTFSEYLGDEVVVSVPSTNGKLGEPVLLAEARRPGLKEFIDAQIHGAGGHAPIAVMLENNVMVLGPRANAQLAARISSGTHSGFLSTPLGTRIAQSYQSGAGWIFAADMEQIIGKHVTDSNVTNPAATNRSTANAGNITGVDNLRFIVVERKENLGRTENRAAISFAGSRHGIASWLAAPGPMGSLDFVSPSASFAGSFVIKNPGTLLDELIGMAGGDPGIAQAIAEVQQQTGVNLHDDVAASLGGEMTVAVDGPLLPTPSWKVALEVYNPSRLEWAIEQVVNAARNSTPNANLQLTNQQVNGLTYYTLSTPSLPVEVNYVFADGYMLAAATRDLLTTSIQSRAAGLTLARSAGFRAQLPQDANLNFSAILYYNFGAVLGPMVDQLKATGLMPKEMQQSADAIAANRDPSLIYAYGESDQIVVATRSNGFFGLGLDSLVGLNGKGAGMFPQLLGPMTSLGRNGGKAPAPPQRQ
jgi:ferric-dicitrate binding protein FerR (iron transport regulator)